MPNVLGIKYLNHDTGAALISDEKIVAISEERLDRQKHSPNTFPIRSIDYCLGAMGLAYQDVDLVVTDAVSFEARLEGFKKESESRMRALFPNAAIHFVNHHDAHAASAFFCSPFSEAAILVHDGFGEEFLNHEGLIVAESDTTYFGEGDRFYQIDKIAHRKEGEVFPFTIGVGSLYAWLTENYVGLGRWNEGKLMGLAPYGDDSILRQFPFGRWFKEERGKIFCNARLTYIPDSLKETIRKVNGLRKFWKILRDRVGRVFDKIKIERKGHLFPKLVLPKPPRRKSVALPDNYYASVAYAGQKVLEEVTMIVCKKLFAITRCQNIAIAGGVGLNIDANTRIINETGFKRIFIQPAASDCGIPFGAALYGYHCLLQKPRFFTMDHAYLGRPYSDKEIEEAIRERSDEITDRISSEVAKETAKLIADGKIVGWFQGGSEYGPRALGHRSILADARHPSMRDIVNRRVKHREMWRPFAASVLKEHSQDFFDLKEESPFMILLSNVRQEKRDKIPSVVHVDGTCRIQTVTKEANGIYHDLIREFHKITEVPLLLNTSFNLGGEPIVETPNDALKSFLNTDMDYLVLGNYIVQKKV